MTHRGFSNLTKLARIQMEKDRLIDSEDRIHQAIYVWFHNEYPQLRGLLCYNLNNSRNAIDGNKNKLKGLQAGRSDLTFYFHGRAFFFEVKNESGTQSSEQKAWEVLMQNNGFNYYIVRNLDEFKAKLIAILSHFNYKAAGSEVSK